MRGTPSGGLTECSCTGGPRQAASRAAVFAPAGAPVGAAGALAPGPVMVPAGFSALASIEASSGSAMFFLNDLMPLAKSPIRLLTLPPPNSSKTTSSTTIQCQMLKLPTQSSVPRLVPGPGPRQPVPRTHGPARAGMQAIFGQMPAAIDCRRPGDA